MPISIWLKICVTHLYIQIQNLNFKNGSSVFEFLTQKKGKIEKLKIHKTNECVSLSFIILLWTAIYLERSRTCRKY